MADAIQQHHCHDLLMLLRLPDLLLPVLMTLAASGVHAQTRDTGVLPDSIRQQLQQQGIPAQALSVVVMRADNGQTVLQQQATQAVSPASSMKILTTLAGLEELGPVFRWKTQLLSTATPEKEVLNGDLYLRGGGDPSLSLEKWTSFLRRLRYSGIKTLRGDLVLDRSSFQPEREDLQATPFDEHPDAAYNVIPDALLLNHNLLQFAIESDGKRIQTRLQTPLANVVIRNNLKLNTAPCASWEKSVTPPVALNDDNGDIEIRLNGSFPKNCQISTRLNLMDRNQYVAAMFAQIWRELGGVWRGQVREGKAPADATLLLEHQSETLADLLRTINKQSDNTMARALLQTLGSTTSGISGNAVSSRTAGDLRIRQWLTKHQLDEQGLVIDNGSGLSRTERISARTLAGVLQAGWRSPWNAEFISSLPIGGMDGTLRKRLKGTVAEGRARLKTGTLRNATALAGYVRDLQDTPWIVVAIVNDEQAAKARKALDQLILWVVAGHPEQWQAPDEPAPETQP